jgi:receptor-type tyrosine-protein phosphatase A
LFIYKALWEAFVTGVTEISVSELAGYVQELYGDDGFAQQYERLNLLTLKMDDSEFSQAREHWNVPKNRNLDILPYNSKRVILNHQCSIEGGEYFNGVFVDSYKVKDGFIATEHPLPSTFSNFWNMVWQKNTHTVVMLNDLDGEEDPAEQQQADDQIYSNMGIVMQNYERFWPKSIKEDIHGGITVKKRASTAEGDFCIRKFSVFETKHPKQTMQCSLFQLKGWSEGRLPRDINSILKLATMVEKNQVKNARQPVVVMCSDGASRTGTFISILVMLEKMKLEQMVDVFQTVKKARASRYQFVKDCEQYKFCYDAAMAYLDSFSNYENC